MTKRKITVEISEKADHALNRASDIMGQTRTQSVERAAIFYYWFVQQEENGAIVTVNDKIVRFF